jgi:hypothetical protein
MKPITTIAAILLASLAAAGSAYAQDHAAKANVPFGFFVAGTWLPGGTYTLTSDSRSPNVIAIRNAEGKIAVLSVGSVEEKQSRPGTLVFKKYGDQYFLHEISCSACLMNIGFADSRREKAARAHEASVAPATDVYLALK